MGERHTSIPGRLFATPHSACLKAPSALGSSARLLLSVTRATERTRSVLDGHPFEDLDPKHIKTIFYGSANREIPFTYVDQTGERVLRAHSFEGIIPNLERRFDETESQTVRDQLSQYQVTQPCRTCRGQRLSRDSLAVRIDGRNFAQISDLSIQDASDYFEVFQLSGYRGEVADKILTE